MNKSVFHLAFAILLTLAGYQPVKAQYYSTNFDYTTIAAMVSGYGAEAGIEMMYQQNTSKIAESYAYSEVATAGIFASKLLDRNALKSSSGFGNPDENYYYRKIYRLVANKIIPRTISVTEKLIKDPSTAIYWGSHLLRVMADTKSLCQQFSTVVTNSTLDFNDIPFLAFNAALQQVFDLQTLGNMRHTLENLANIESNFTTENIEHEFDNLQNLAVGLAGAGSASIDSIASGSLFDGTFKQNVSKISQMVENNTAMWNNFSNAANATLSSITNANEDDITAILTTNHGDTQGWISGYSSGSDAQYYKQRVYIYHIDSGSEQIFSYTPPTDDDAILYGDHWYRINTTDPNFFPDSNQREAALQNSEAHAGWSRARVNQMNQSNDGYNYSINYWSSAYILSRSKSGQYAKAYAYEIYVTRSWYNNETYYEDTFDSYSMDWNIFMNKMNAKLEEANRNESGKVYRIGYDSKRYYTASNARKLAGATQANFVTKCEGNGKVADGSIQYKCSNCGGSPNEHTKNCSMATSLQSNDFDFQEIKNAIQSKQNELTGIQRQIDALNAENRSLLTQISNATAEEAISLRAKYNENRNKISDLQKQYDTINQELADLKSAKQEAIEFENSQTDNTNRIPNIMHNLQTNFQLEWIDEGHWEGFTFVRQANMRNLKSVVTFRAKVSIARGPKYFLFIKIHRAIVKIEWELDAEYSDSQVIETMQLDPNADAQQQSDKVNQRLQQLQQDYPDCTVSVEYEYASGLQEDNDDDDKVHLLWASDRLDVAREICHRLEQMYVDLVVLDKFLHYKYSILDWLRDLTVNNLHAERGRRLTIAERSRRRWMHNAQSALYEREEEDDNYEED